MRYHIRGAEELCLWLSMTHFFWYILLMLSSNCVFAVSLDSFSHCVRSLFEMFVLWDNTDLSLESWFTGFAILRPIPVKPNIKIVGIVFP